jgi:uncharacterized RDD family membrane protein YckC
VVQGQPAGLVSRAVAGSIDLAATTVAVLSFYLAIGAAAFVLRPRSFRWPDPGLLRLGGIWWALLVVYLTVGWTASGRTIGNQVMGLRVTDQAGGRLRGGRAFIRALLCATFPIGLLWCAIDRRGRALHDLLVRSMVAYDWVPTSSGTPATPSPAS